MTDRQCNPCVLPFLSKSDKKLTGMVKIYNAKPHLSWFNDAHFVQECTYKRNSSYNGQEKTDFTLPWKWVLSLYSICLFKASFNWALSLEIFLNTRRQVTLGQLNHEKRA